MLEKITSKDFYLDFLSNIENKKPFSFVRFGDGEWGAILKNSEKHKKLIAKWGESIVEVGEELNNILMGESPKQDNYYLGIQPLSYRPHMFKNEIDKMTDGLNICNADVFHNHSSDGTIYDFFNILKNKEIILVGPWYMKKLNIFDFKHVETPEYHSWLHLGDIKRNVEYMIDLNKNQIFLFSCSLAAKICIDYFYKLYGNNIIQIDIGSVLDPYCGVSSRGYHKTVIDRLGFNIDDVVIPKII